MSEELARVTTELHGAAMLVRLDGEIDMSNAAAVENRVAGRLGDAAAVVVDLGGLGYLDSAGLAVLSRLAGLLAGAGRALALVVPDHAVVRRTVAVAGLDTVLPVHPSAPAALAALAAIAAADGPAA